MKKIPSSTSWTRAFRGGARAVAMATLVAAGAAYAQSQSILLWPDGAPGSEGKTGAEVVRIAPGGDHVVSSIHQPSLVPYFPKEDATGAAVIIAPGGGHSELWIDHEGYREAEWLSQRGVAAFVLKYRLAREKGSTYTVEGTELGDMQRAIRVVRSNSREWKIDPDRVGVMGFSAGGELAALASTRYDAGSAGAADPVERQGSRPAFQALLYPAIPRAMRLSKETPPAFLACGEKDRPDISEGLPKLYLSLKDAGVSAELHVYGGIGHGFGIRQTNPEAVSGWPLLFIEWLKSQGFLAAGGSK